MAAGILGVAYAAIYWTILIFLFLLSYIPNQIVWTHKSSATHAQMFWNDFLCIFSLHTYMPVNTLDKTWTASGSSHVVQPGDVTSDVIIFCYSPIGSKPSFPRHTTRSLDTSRNITIGSYMQVSPENNTCSGQTFAEMSSQCFVSLVWFMRLGTGSQNMHQRLNKLK